MSDSSLSVFGSMQILDGTFKGRLLTFTAVLRKSSSLPCGNHTACTITWTNLCGIYAFPEYVDTCFDTSLTFSLRSFKSFLYSYFRKHFVSHNLVLF